MAVIGLGTHHRLRDGGAIVRAAIQTGCVHIDTAPNYGEGLNQREIGQVVYECARGSSPEVFISTKVGFLSRSVTSGELAQEGIDFAKISHGHCLSPAFVRFQVERNRQELKARAIKLLFLHNPEEQLRTHSTKAKALELFLKASEACEDLCARGKIQSYGLATWRHFLECITIQELCSAARNSFGSGHHFKALQLPLSLVSITAIADGLFKKEGPLIEARDEGLQVFGSSPLHQGELLRHMSTELVDSIDPSLTAAQAALHVILSTRLVDVVLIGTNQHHHLAEAIAVSQQIPLCDDRLNEIVKMLL